MRAIAFCVLAAALAFPGIAAGQDLMEMGAGAEVVGIGKIGNKQVPLPGGKWEVVMSDTDRRGSGRAGAVFLVQRADERIVAYLYVRTNLDPGSGTGWKRPGWCQRNNVHHNGSDNHYNNSDADCWIVNHRVDSNRVSRVDILNRMKDWLRKQDPEGRTATALGNWYWRNDHADYIFVSHFLNPTHHGFQPERGVRWGESEWHFNAIGQGTPHQRFVADIKAFGAEYRQSVRNGFSNKLAGSSVPAFTSTRSR